MALVLPQKKEETKEKTFLEATEVSLNPDYFVDQAFSEKKSKPKVDKETGKESQIVYYSAPLSIKANNSKGEPRAMESFVVEGPLMTSKRGIKVMCKDGKWEASIKCIHNTEDPETVAFCGWPVDPKDWKKMPEITENRGMENEVRGRDQVGFMTSLYMRCLWNAFANRKAINLEVTKIEGLEGVFKNPLKWATTDDGTLMPDVKPTRWYKVVLFGDPEKPETGKANFTMSVPKTEKNKKGEMVLDWCYLMNAKLALRPLLRFKSVYCGAGKVSIQMDMLGGVIDDFDPCNTSSEQTKTLDKQRADTDRVQHLQDQLAKARALLGIDENGNKIKPKEDTSSTEKESAGKEKKEDKSKSGGKKTEEDKPAASKSSKKAAVQSDDDSDDGKDSTPPATATGKTNLPVKGKSTLVPPKKSKKADPPPETQSSEVPVTETGQLE